MVTHPHVQVCAKREDVLIYIVLYFSHIISYDTLDGPTPCRLKM
jgi:hypothetical protein